MISTECDWCSCSGGYETHHVLAALHELLVDDLAGIVLAGLDVDGLLDDGVRAAPKGFACPVLESRIDSYQPRRSVGKARGEADLTGDG